MPPEKTIRCPSKDFFAIIFEGRTGSSYVVSVLNRYPSLLCYPEILADQSGPGQKKILNALVKGFPVETLNAQAANAQYYHNNLDQKRNLEAVGFKVKLNQVIHLEHFCGFLERHAFKLIYLTRKNLVKSAVSELNAERLRKQYRRSNAQIQAHVQGSLYVAPRILERELRRREKLTQAHCLFYKACQTVKYTFYYEDLLADQAPFFHTLFAVLEVSPRPHRGNFLKNTPDDLSDAIENYTEIRQYFQDTRFNEYFDL